SVLLLALLSIVTIFSTTYLISNASSLRPTILQILWYVIGTITIILLIHFDTEQMWKLPPVAYFLWVALLILVLIFYERRSYDLQRAKSWFVFGPVSFQPSEVVKISLIMMLGRVITKHNVNTEDRTLKTDWYLLLKIMLWS